MKSQIAALLVSILVCGCATTSSTRTSTTIPPPMPRRNIAPPKEPLPGESVVLSDRGTNFTLFLPKGWEKTIPASGKTVLRVHFHSAIWFAIQEHLRCGLTGPLICFHLGEGSSVYRIPFEDRERFSRCIRIVEMELKKRGSPRNTRIAAVEVSSFSAGYGAVRELVKSPEYCKIIRRIVLCDSMYGSFDEAALKNGIKKPALEHIAPWTPFAKAAARGEKTFCFTHSEVPTDTYANSALCAVALIEAVGAPKEEVARGSSPATNDPEFPLRRRSDLGRFHVWSYAGEDGQAHMTHARHLADVWLALDAAEKKKSP